MDLPSRADLFAAARRYAKQQPAPKINPAVIDVPGSNLNLLFGGASLMGEMITAAWAKCIRGLFVSTAVGAQLDNVIADRFGITRLPANPASADLKFIRPTSGGGGGTIPAGSQIQTAKGSIFSLATDVVFGSTDLVQQSTPARPLSAIAQIVGSSQNVEASTLTSFIDQPFDSTITVTNPTGAAGGTDVESDAAFRARALRFFLTLRRGILAAIEYGATTVPGVAVASAFDIVNPGNALPAGAVQLVIADSNGNASSTMIQSVADVQLSYRSGGIPVFTTGGSVIFEQVAYQLAFQAGIDTAAATEAVRATMVAISQFYRPGQPLLEDDVRAAARAVPGVIVKSGSILAPEGDVYTTSNNQIIRVRPQDVTFVQ